eukprot:gene13388-biopygen9559
MTAVWADSVSSIRSLKRAQGLNWRPWVGRRHPAHGGRDLRDGPGAARRGREQDFLSGGKGAGWPGIDCRWCVLGCVQYERRSPKSWGLVSGPAPYANGKNQQQFKAARLR